MSQNFRKKVPNELIFDLLDEYASKNDKYYIVDNVFYKKLQFNNVLSSFLESMKQYYHVSKQYYLTRTQNYVKFLTVIRQICKFNNLSFTSNTGKAVFFNQSTSAVLIQCCKNANAISPYEHI